MVAVHPYPCRYNNIHDSPMHMLLTHRTLTCRLSSNSILETVPYALIT